MSEIKCNEETKICKKCGKILPLDNFRLKKGEFHNPYYSGSCKACDVLYSKAYLDKKNEIRVNTDLEIYFEREYKEIHPSRILDTSDMKITLLGTDEIFVKMMDYKNTWISNYGRMLRCSYGKYNMLNGSYDGNGNLRYNVGKNVFIDGKWVYKQVIVYAAQAVVDTFIVNMDKAQNKFIWHSGFDREDNYYKNLYPLNQEQYRVVRNHYMKHGDVPEEIIIIAMNDIRYMPDDWGRNCLKPIMAGMGFRGYGDCNLSSDAYVKWHNMMERCYNEGVQENSPKYKGCTVCKEWHNFQNFKIWYEAHKYGSTPLDLDKDILIKGNKVYSSETCCLVPKQINTLFTYKQRERDENTLPVGVWKDGNRYRAEINVFGKSKKLGYYDTAEEAFKRYKTYKMDFIQTIADSYKDEIPENVYRAMLDWQVEITD